MRKLFFYPRVWIMGLTWLSISQCAWSASLKDVSQNLMGPTEVLTKLFILACYLIGAALIFASFAQYKIHRQSPKLVPLTTPIWLFLLGLILVLLPYLSKVMGNSFNAEEQAKREGRVEETDDSLPFFPSAEPKEGPGRLPPDKPLEPYPPEKKQRKSGKGHWSDDPRYQ
jgi:hypothetical protein